MNQITLGDITKAATRIKAHVRATPVMEAAPLIDPLSDKYQLFLKLEQMQITGSFKARLCLGPQ